MCKKDVAFLLNLWLCTIVSVCLNYVLYVNKNWSYRIEHISELN